MASDSSGGAPKKLSTQEILAKARAEAAKKAAGAEAAPAPAAESAATPAPAANPAPATAPAKAPAAAGAKPKSTAEILAAARAAKAGASAPEAVAADAPAPAAPKPAPKPAAAGGSKSTADILAAARANKAGGSPAPASVTPAADKPAAMPAAAKPIVAAAAVASDVSVEEMLAAVRPGGPVAKAVAAEQPVAAPKVAPPMPPRPVVAPKPAAKKGDGETRRGFMVVLAMLASPFFIAWAAVTATAGVWTLGLARFMLPNVLTEPPSKFKIGPPTDYDLGTVATKWVAQFGIWIVHTDQYKSKNLIYALASVCTHLGCTPSWLEGERKFKCPCHGSGFYITGVNFEGPAPRPLERVGIRLSEDGMLEVDKSVKFQEEMGQWNDGASFFEVTA